MHRDGSTRQLSARTWMARSGGLKKAKNAAGRREAGEGQARGSQVPAGRSPTRVPSFTETWLALRPGHRSRPPAGWEEGRAAELSCLVQRRGPSTQRTHTHTHEYTRTRSLALVLALSRSLDGVQLPARSAQPPGGQTPPAPRGPQGGASALALADESSSGRHQRRSVGTRGETVLFYFIFFGTGAVAAAPNCPPPPRKGPPGPAVDASIGHQLISRCPLGADGAEPATPSHARQPPWPRGSRRRPRSTAEKQAPNHDGRRGRAACLPGPGLVPSPASSAEAAPAPGPSRPALGASVRASSRLPCRWSPFLARLCLRA